LPTPRGAGEGECPRIEAVVFDLDDTLIDTSGQLLEPAHREAAEAMVRAGLCASVEAVARRRMELATLRPGEDLDAIVAEDFGSPGDPALIAAARKAFFERRIERLDALPEVAAVLAALRAAGRRRFLVTAGHEPTQRRKLELCGLIDVFDGAGFVPSDAPDKGPAIEKVLAEHGLRAESVLVVGDRLDRDVEPARRLGCWTARVDRGEGRHQRPQNRWQQPHYTIPGVEALEAVIADIEAGHGA
jgi:putative hydrolase of the HAD superfamily